MWKLFLVSVMNSPHLPLKQHQKTISFYFPHQNQQELTRRRAECWKYGRVHELLWTLPRVRCPRLLHNFSKKLWRIQKLRESVSFCFNRFQFQLIINKLCYLLVTHRAQFRQAERVALVRGAADIVPSQKNCDVMMVRRLVVHIIVHLLPLAELLQCFLSPIRHHWTGLNIIP